MVRYRRINDSECRGMKPVSVADYPVQEHDQPKSRDAERSEASPGEAETEPMSGQQEDTTLPVTAAPSVPMRFARGFLGKLGMTVFF